MGVVVRKMDFSKLRRADEAIKAELPPFMADVIRTETSPYVPFLTGALNSSAYANEAAIRAGMIKWGGTYNSDARVSTSAYASAQHDGYPNKTRSFHPDATVEWTKAAERARGNAWRTIAEHQARVIAGRCTR